MSVGPSRKAAATTPNDDRSLPALLARLKKLREHTPGDLSVEDAESELKRIERAKLSKAQAGKERKNLRDRILYALTDVPALPPQPAAPSPLPQPAVPPLPPPDLMDVQHRLSALNICAHEGAWVRVLGLMSKSNLNGVVARLGAWNAEKSRWQLAHGGRILLVRERNVWPLSQAETRAADAEEVAAETFAAVVAELALAVAVEVVAAGAAKAAEAARLERAAAAESATKREQKFERAQYALDSLSSIDGHPISPAGYFNSRSRLLDWYEYGEPPPDQSSRKEGWKLASECAAWSDEVSKFCCVGAPHYCADGRLPHHVIASAAQPQRALLHLVEWTCLTAPGSIRVEISVGRQCQSCACMLLDKGCPLSIVPVAAFCKEQRAREEHALAATGCCAPMRLVYT